MFSPKSAHRGQAPRPSRPDGRSRSGLVPTACDRQPVAARVRRWLRRGDRSAVATELGIIAVPFFMMFLGTMEMSYDLYVQASLDNAVELAARGVQVGGAVGSKNQTSSSYIASNVCPNLGGLLNCSLLTVGVAPLPANLNYYTNPTPLTQAAAVGGTGICTGKGGQMMVLQAWYDGPTFVGLLVPSFITIYNGVPVHLTTASAGFVNEWFPGTGQTSGTACGNGT